MTIELSIELESAVLAEAQARGLTPDRYVKELIERNLHTSSDSRPHTPLKSGLGMWSKYGIALTDDDIAANRADMFRNFGEDLR